MVRGQDNGLFRWVRPDCAELAFVLTREERNTLLASMNILLLPKRVIAIADTYVNEMPNAEETAEIALMAADEMRRFGIEPKVALLSHSNFGSARSASSLTRMNSS